MKRVLLSNDPEATEALGEAVGRGVPRGVVVTLDGDLGAGKTTLVRGLARGLGVEDDVASPTYTLMQAHGGGRLPLYHFDAWMEGREKALLADGADELLGQDGVAVVEWSDRVVDWLPAPRLAIRLAHVDPEVRRIEIEVVPGAEGRDDPLAGPLEALAASLEAVPGLEEVSDVVPGTEIP